MVQETGKYTVITGASSGIGYEAAKAFAKREKNLVITARRENNLEMLKREILEKHPDLDIVIRSTVSEYDYDKSFGTYHTSKQVTGFLLELYDSEKVVGLVDRESFRFRLADPLFPYAGNSSHNQQRM